MKLMKGNSLKSSAHNSLTIEYSPGLCLNLPLLLREAWIDRRQNWLSSLILLNHFHGFLAPAHTQLPSPFTLHPSPFTLHPSPFTPTQSIPSGETGARARSALRVFSLLHPEVSVLMVTGLQATRPSPALGPTRRADGSPWVGMGGVGGVHVF